MGRYNFIYFVPRVWLHALPTSQMRELNKRVWGEPYTYQNVVTQ
jgi:hypothetical protein